MTRMALPILVEETVVLFAVPFAKIAVGVGLAALYPPQRVQRSILARSWHRNPGLPW